MVNIQLFTSLVIILLCSPDPLVARKKSNIPKGNGSTALYILFVVNVVD